MTALKHVLHSCHLKYEAIIFVCMNSQNQFLTHLLIYPESSHVRIVNFHIPKRLLCLLVEATVNG